MVDRWITDDYGTTVGPIKIDDGTPIETAKAILINMDEILNEMEKHLEDLNDAIFGPKPITGESCNTTDDSILTTLKRQRDTAGKLLDHIVRIRRGLW